jgi:hypothetical protein
MVSDKSDEEDLEFPCVSTLKRQLDRGYEMVLIARAVDTCHEDLLSFLNRKLERQFDPAVWLRVEKILRDHFKLLRDNLVATTALDAFEQPIYPESWRRLNGSEIRLVNI